MIIKPCSASFALIYLALREIGSECAPGVENVPGTPTADETTERVRRGGLEGASPNPNFGKDRNVY